MNPSLSSDAAHGVAARDRPSPGGVPWAEHRRLRTRAAIMAVVASGALLLAYVGLVGWANSLAHAIGELVRLWYWMVPLVAGFGLQVGLFAYARGAARAESAPHASGVLASGGASTLSMAACCAHHVTDVLPLLGLAGAGLFLSRYQTLFLLLGVLSNAVGTTYLLSLLGRHGLVPAAGSILSVLPGLPWRAALLGVAGLSAAGVSLATLVSVS